MRRDETREEPGSKAARGKSAVQGTVLIPTAGSGARERKGAASVRGGEPRPSAVTRGAPRGQATSRAEPETALLSWSFYSSMEIGWGGGVGQTAVTCGVCSEEGAGRGPE